MSRAYIFLDDERFPNEKTFPDTRQNTIYICRTTWAASDIILGSNEHTVFTISFDHDLGEDSETGFDLAQFLVNFDMDHPDRDVFRNFEFYVHSQNPIGKANIEGLLNGYLEFKRNS